MQSHEGPQLVAELPQSLKNATASKYFGLSNVRYGSLADIGQRIRDVRFIPRSGHSSVQVACPLLIVAHDTGPSISSRSGACPNLVP